jgi:hypothetical protein
MFTLATQLPAHTKVHPNTAMRLLAISYLRKDGRGVLEATYRYDEEMRPDDRIGDALKFPRASLAGMEAHREHLRLERHSANMVPRSSI